MMKMMKSEYSFTLTDAQRIAIRDVGLSDADVSFSATGMVNATVFSEYEITCYAFGGTGGIVKETRGLESGGWDTVYRNTDGMWIDELGVLIEE